MGKRESLNGRKNVARRKVKNSEKNPWGPGGGGGRGGSTAIYGLYRYVPL